MSLKVDLTEVTRIRQEGGKNVLEEVVDGARKFYCNLYTKNPYWVMVRNTIILPIVEDSLSNICGDFVLPPPPPPPPFNGGQCPGIQYEILVVTEVFFNDDPRPDKNSRFLLFGEITKVDLTRESVGSGAALTVEAFGKNVQGDFAFGNDPVGGLGWTGQIKSVVINRVDNLSDNCGDIEPPGYTPVPPPANSDINGTVNVTNNNGDINNYFVSVNRDPGGTIVFPPVINIHGVSVSIDIGGATISNETNKFSGGGGGSNGDTISETEPPPPEKLREEEQEEEEQGDEKAVEKLVAIIVNITKTPDNAPVTDGKGAPDIYYAGWIEFKNKGTFYRREFINFVSSRFQAPDENDGYAVTYKEGFAGRITEITIEEPN